MSVREENQPISDSNTWVLTTKRVGDCVAGWVVDEIFERDVRHLQQSERCKLTSFCYPTGAKMVRARLLRANASVKEQQLAS